MAADRSDGRIYFLDPESGEAAGQLVQDEHPVLETGVIAGYPVVEVRVAITDGKEHPVDSKDIAFQIAGREVFKLAVKSAGPVLLEPIYKYTITVPEEYMGDVMGDLNRRRGLPQGMDDTPSGKVIRAEVPLAEMFGYASELRTITSGRGEFTMHFENYEAVPFKLIEEIIEERKKKA